MARHLQLTTFIHYGYGLLQMLPYRYIYNIPSCSSALVRGYSQGKPLETRKLILVPQVVSIFKGVLSILPLEQTGRSPTLRGILFYQGTSLPRLESVLRPLTLFSERNRLFSLPRGEWSSHTSSTNLLTLSTVLKGFVRV